MKKIIWLKVFLTSFCLLFVLGLSANAAASLNDAFKVNDHSYSDPLDSLADKAGYNTSEPDINNVIGNIIQTALSMMGVIFVLLIVYGGVIWMLARGKEERVEKAQGIIRNAIIGLIIVLSAYAISYFIISALSQTTLAK